MNSFFKTERNTHMEGKITITLVPDESGTMCEIDTNVHWGKNFEDVVGGKIHIIKGLLQAFDFSMFELTCLYDSIGNNDWPDGLPLYVGEGIIEGDRKVMLGGNYDPDKLNKEEKECPVKVN